MKLLLKPAVAIVLTLVLAFWLIRHFPQIKSNVAVRDSIAYWSAARFLDHYQNPYDHRAVFDLEKQQGYKGERPLVLRTPPWSLFMVSPLGLLPPFWAWAVWILISVACLIGGMRICTRMYGNSIPSNLLTIVGYTFAPVPACLVSGQMGLVLMIGAVLFFWWEKERPLLAGAALVLPFAKPHLLSLFWLILVFWVIRERKMRVAIGFVTAVCVAAAFSLVLDAEIFSHYGEMLRTAAIGHEFIPALSGVIRLLFFRRFFWVQFVPMFFGLVWAIWFFFKKASMWDWQLHGPALLTVSVLTTPYEWLSDETVLLPAILQAAALAYAARETMRLRSKLALIAFVLLDALLLLILKAKVPFSTGIYFWSSIVWFAFYFCAHKWHARLLRQNPEVESITPVLL